MNSVTCARCGHDMAMHYSSGTMAHQCHAGMLNDPDCLCDQRPETPDELQQSLYAVMNSSGQFMKEISVRGKKSYSWDHASYYARTWKDINTAHAAIRQVRMEGRAWVIEYRPRFVKIIDDPHAQERAALQLTIKNAKAMLDDATERLRLLDTRPSR